MSGVLFDSLYNSELPNMKGCAQWKIKLQLSGKGGLVIVLGEFQQCMTDTTAASYFY